DSLLLADEDGVHAGPPIEIRGAVPLAASLHAIGLPARVGAVLTSPRVVRGDARRRLAASGALAVDMETYRLAAAAPGRPLAVVRAVVDTPSEPLARPGTVRRGLAALRTLRRAVPALEEWATSASPCKPAQEVV
ncbi:MAG: 4-hydroxy-3-methylbut-2-enyl diphosphate reductase, partial [Actinomycetes bacterium]